MKITLEIPDGTICAFFASVEADGDVLKMMSYRIASDDIYDGSQIKCSNGITSHDTKFDGENE